MDSKRAHTYVFLKRLVSALFLLFNLIGSLKALSTFIQTQKSLLAKTKSDIERLRTLKNEAVSEPEFFMSNLSHKVRLALAYSFRLFFEYSIDSSIMIRSSSANSWNLHRVRRRM
jgi:hypothetical protein